MDERCEVSVELDDTEETYTSGETICGTVEVTTGAAPIEEAELIVTLAEPLLVRPESEASSGSVPPEKARPDPEQRTKSADVDEDDYEVVW